MESPHPPPVVTNYNITFEGDEIASGEDLPFWYYLMLQPKYVRGDNIESIFEQSYYPEYNTTYKVKTDKLIMLLYNYPESHLRVKGIYVNNKLISSDYYFEYINTNQSIKEINIKVYIQYDDNYTGGSLFAYDSEYPIEIKNIKTGETSVSNSNRIAYLHIDNYSSEIYSIKSLVETSLVAFNYMTNHKIGLVNQKLQDYDNFGYIAIPLNLSNAQSLQF